MKEVENLEKFTHCVPVAILLTSYIQIYIDMYRVKFSSIIFVKHCELKLSIFPVRYYLACIILG